MNEIDLLLGVKGQDEEINPWKSVRWFLATKNIGKNIAATFIAIATFIATATCFKIALLKKNRGR